MWIVCEIEKEVCSGVETFDKLRQGVRVRGALIILKRTDVRTFQPQIR
jgi:hypothetical protein